MSFDYTTGNPDNLTGGHDASMVDIQGPFVDLRTFLNQRIAAIPTLVSSLPVAPVDGQEVYFLADASNGVVWHLRFRAASGSTYKWEFVGGPPMGAEDTTEVTGANVGYSDIGTVLGVTLPLAGDYRIRHGAQMRLTTATLGSALASVKLGAAATANTEALTVGLSSNNTPEANSSRSFVRTLATAGSVVKQQYAVTAGSGAWKNRFVEATPVRVG